MLIRWSRYCYDIDKFLSFLDILIPDFYVYHRGRSPKHSPREYLKLIILKEYLRASLRDANVFISIYFLGYRVPWTVIHYWEKRLAINFKKDVVKVKSLKYIGIDVNLMNITIYIPDEEAKIEYYKLLKNGDVTKTTGYEDKDSIQLLKKIDGKAIIIDISILCNIHRTYELKRNRLQELAKKKPKTMKRIMDKYSHREQGRVNDLIHKLTKYLLKYFSEKQYGVFLENLNKIKENTIANGNGDDKSRKTRRELGK